MNIDDELTGDEAAVLAALSERDASVPPPAIRGALLARIARSPRTPIRRAAPLDVFTGMVESMSELLDGLDADEWSLTAAPYRWTVHGLLAHLLVIEQYTATRIGVPGASYHDLGVDAHLELGAHQIAAEVRLDPIETARTWKDTANATIAHVRQHPLDRDGIVTLHGLSFPGEGVLIGRAFEIWTHADDIRRATGRALAPPPAAHLRTMSAFSVSTLALLAPGIDPDAGPPSARVVLTGEGGSTFDIGPVGRRATLVVDVGDYCRMAARRIEPEQLVCTIEGDQRLAKALIGAARTFAV